MRISDWSSDVCSSDLRTAFRRMPLLGTKPAYCWRASWSRASNSSLGSVKRARRAFMVARDDSIAARVSALGTFSSNGKAWSLATRVSVMRTTSETVRSEEHTSDLQSLMRSSYAVFCLKKKKNHVKRPTKHRHHQQTE